MLPPEPSEGCTINVVAEDSDADNNPTIRRLSRRFAADEVGGVVLAWLESEGYGSVGERWIAVDATTNPRRPLDVPAFRGRTLQACGLWPSARLVLTRPAPYELTVRTARPSDGSVAVRARAGDAVADVAARACAGLPALRDVPSRRVRECRLCLGGAVLDGSARIGDVLGGRRAAVLFLARPLGESPAAAPRPTRDTVLRGVPPGAPTPEDAGAPTCRICYGEGDQGADDPLISPCKCRGSMRFVHVSCLNAWRAAAPDSRQQFECGQCRFGYEIRRTRVAAFLQSDAGAAAIAAALGLALVVALGSIGLVTTDAARRRRLYSWLRLSHGFGSLSAAREIAYLGGAAVGLLVFALYAAAEAAVAYARYSAGVALNHAATPALLLGAYVVAEVRDARRGRALAVIGLALACRGLYHEALRKARALSHRIGDRVLDVRG